ncbi:MAG: hypothetical protein WCI41_03755 [bacterium]
MKKQEEDATNQETTVKLDVSIAEYLFASTKQKVNKENLTSEEWVGILRKVVDRSKPFLTYFDSYNEIGKLLSTKWFSWFFGAKVEYLDGINEKTKIIPITEQSLVLTSKKGPEIPINIFNSSFGTKKQFSIREEIFLTSKGDIILLICERDESIPDNFRFTKLVFKKLSDEELLVFVKNSFSFVTQPLCCLKDIVNIGLKRREEQLFQMKEIKMFLTRICDLIND